MTTEQPSGQLVIRTIAMPADTNSNGDIFGGWLVSQMDLGASTLAHQRSQSRCVTVAISNLAFMRPVRVGDIVCCYAELVKVGNTSMTIDLTTWTYTANSLRQQKVANGTFVFVAIDEHGKPRSISP